jgi:hypothetical protein
MASYKLRGFTFTPSEGGGLVIDADAHSLHLAEDELFELLAAVGLSADSVEEEEVETLFPEVEEEAEE